MTYLTMFVNVNDQYKKDQYHKIMNVVQHGISSRTQVGCVSCLFQC